MNEVYIYGLAEPFLPAEIRYVGATTNLINRFENHCCASGKEPKDFWIKDLKARGLLPTCFVLEVATKETASRREMYWARRYSGIKLLNKLKPIECEDIPPVKSPVTFADAEKNHLLAAIAKCPTNKTHLAQYLGISRPALYDKLKKHGIAL